MSISNGWFAVSVYRCLERRIPPLLAGTSGVVRARLQESFSSAILLENPTRAQGKKGNLYKSPLLERKQASKCLQRIGAASRLSRVIL